MRQLYPGEESSVGSGKPADVTEAVVAEDRTTAGDRPWLFVNMVASIDGATAIAGASGGLGGTGDRLVFRGLRASADFIIVGASTVRAERYRPPQAYPEAAAHRAGRNQGERPRLAVITNSLDLDPSLPLFDDEPGPIVFHPPTAKPANVAALETMAELVAIEPASNSGKLPLSAVIDDLAARGARRILSEGGPTLNGQLTAEGLVDEWNLTLTPLAIGGESPRAAVGPTPHGPPPAMTLRRVWTDEGYLFCRWTRQN